MDPLILIATEVAERTDLVSVLLTLMGGGGVALASQRALSWMARRKRKGKYGLKWGTWFAVVDLDANERELERAKAEAATAKAEAARQMERALAIQREAEARVARSDALIKQCQEHTAAAIRERDSLALRMATQQGVNSENLDND